LDPRVDRVQELPRVVPGPEVDERVLGLARQALSRGRVGAYVALAENVVHVVVVGGYAVYATRELLRVLLG
jgi:hypothetical protein